VDHRLAGSLLCLALGCDAPGEDVSDADDPGAIALDDREAPTDDAAVTHAQPPVGDVAPAADRDASPSLESPPVRAPVETRIARQTLVLRDGPDPRAPLRGRIPLGEAFYVYALVPGRDCGGKGWGDIGEGAYACLEATRKAGDAVPRKLPELRDGDLAPFFYAKVKQGQTARRWKSLASMLAGEEPTGTLEPEHDYAFVGRRRAKGQMILIDERDNVVLESEVMRYRPSRFAGRDLVQTPVPAGLLLAWGVTWPSNPALAEPREAAAPMPALAYQAEILLLPEPTRNAEGRWWALDGGGYLHDRHVGRWSRPIPPESIGAVEVWIDVEIDQQILTVMRGPEPLFATLISSGFKGPTPRGLFRISMKQAIGQMQSRPDAEESYNVEAVPYVQYFAGNFALHGAFWHYRFGHRISHGCVNLSPRDARRVFDMTAPHALPGWVNAYESESAPGTTVRVRRGDEDVQDKRAPPRLLEG